MLHDLASSVARIEARLDRIESRDAIRKLKAAYMQGLDDRRRGAVADLFWPDAIWEALPNRAPDGSGPLTEPPNAAPTSQTAGHDAIAASFEEAAEAMSFTAHFLTNEDITVDGDTATGRWKLLQACTATGGPAFWQAGVYIDTFTRRDGIWRFAHLRLAMDFRTPFDQGWHRTPMWELPA